MKSIRFSQNYNKKLLCAAFTTIRKPNIIYNVGETYNIVLNDIIVKEAKIVDIVHMYPHSLTETMCRLDTGYSKKETLGLLARIYKELPNEIYLITLFTTKTNDSGFKLRLAEATEKLAEQLALNLTGKA